MIKWKRKTAIIITVIVAIMIFITAVVLLDCHYNLRFYFNDWAPETKENLVTVQSDSYLYGNNDLSVYVDGGILDVYCIRDGRIYFCYSTANENHEPRKFIWHIASLTVDYTDFREHFAADITNADTWSEAHYTKLSYLADRTTVVTGLYSNRPESHPAVGGMYSNGCIYLKGKNCVISYDIASDTVKRDDELPVNRYKWTIENFQKIIFEDTENGELHTVTLEEMAKTNVYANRLLKLSSCKRWSGEPYTSDFFCGVKMVDDKIYLICEVFNWNGESFAVVFQYDFDSNSVQYVSNYYVWERVGYEYDFVICYSK